MTYPDSCIRGIRVEKWILEDGNVTDEAFTPDKNNPSNREDGLLETSIHWEDKEEVINICFKKCKNNYRFGAVHIDRKILDHLIANNNVGRFLYERDEVEDADEQEDREFHGNLLFDANIIQRSRRALEGALAFYSSKVQPNPY